MEHTRHMKIVLVPWQVAPQRLLKHRPLTIPSVGNLVGSGTKGAVQYGQGRQGDIIAAGPN